MASLMKQKRYRGRRRKANHGRKPCQGKCSSEFKRAKLKRMK